VEKLRFIDLFAGLGGFHLALKKLGHECVFACEIDPDLIKLYNRNFGIEPQGDIRKVDIETIPAHDILCAGFPCQPFSKAGDQHGLDCPTSGDLIDYVVKILAKHRPKYFILENVPNLLKHNDGKTWESIRKRLQLKGTYKVEAETLSPHNFGVPQIRHRVFIVGSKTSLRNFSWPSPMGKKELSVQSVLDSKPARAKRLSKQVKKCLNVWQEFLAQYPKSEPLPTFPIWSMEFGVDYPFVSSTPYAQQKLTLPQEMRKNGKALESLTRKRSFKSLPSHARTRRVRFPKWKIEFIRQNRALYRRHKKWIDPWLPKIRRFPPSLQKLEWNCNSGKRKIWDYLIQFRASGVRVKKRTSSPSLVAMTTTQVPIVAWEKRYMTSRECARLQSLIGLKYLPKQSTKAFKALGNAVNAHLVELIVRNLLPKPRKVRKQGAARKRSVKIMHKNAQNQFREKNVRRAA
jgi:DNA (cytosine-5)-methyltransferase 1